MCVCLAVQNAVIRLSRGPLEITSTQTPNELKLKAKASLQHFYC